MPIRMPVARKQPDLTEIYATQVDPDQQQRDHYQCANCVAEVFFRKRHKRKGSPVCPIFYSHQNHPHEDHCDFNIPATVRNAIRGSQPFKNSGKIVDDDNGAVFRLALFRTILRTMNADLPRRNPGSEQQEWQAAARTTENTYQPYLRGAKDIIRLMCSSSDYRDVAPHLSLSATAPRVSWENFYYGLGELDRLYNNIERGQIDHPVFAAFRPRTFTPWNNLQAVFGHKEQTAPPDGTGTMIIPAIMTDNPLVCERVMNYGCVGVCATARIDERNVGRNNFSRLVFEVSSTAQVARYPE